MEKNNLTVKVKFRRISIGVVYWKRLEDYRIHPITFRSSEERIVSTLFSSKYINFANICLRYQLFNQTIKVNMKLVYLDSLDFTLFISILEFKVCLQKSVYFDSSSSPLFWPLSPPLLPATPLRLQWSPSWATMMSATSMAAADSSIALYQHTRLFNFDTIM